MLLRRRTASRSYAHVIRLLLYIVQIQKSRLFKEGDFLKQTGCMISVTYRTAVRSTISLPSDWKRQQEQHAVFTMICFLCAFIGRDRLLTKKLAPTCWRVASKLLACRLENRAVSTVCGVQAKEKSHLNEVGFGGDCWTRTSDLLRVKIRCAPESVVPQRFPPPLRTFVSGGRPLSPLRTPRSFPRLGHGLGQAVWRLKNDHAVIKEYLYTSCKGFGRAFQFKY